MSPVAIRRTSSNRPTFTSNLAQWEVEHRKAIDAALKAAAQTYKTAVEARLRLGYKSGTFKTGKVAGSVIVSRVTTTRKGARVIRVGTKNFIARLWEFGHENRFSRRFERVPVWRPVAVAQGQLLAAEALTSYGAMMSHWKARPGAGRSHKRSKR